MCDPLVSRWLREPRAKHIDYDTDIRNRAKPQSHEPESESRTKPIPATSQTQQNRVRANTSQEQHKTWDELQCWALRGNKGGYFLSYTRQHAEPASGWIINLPFGSETNRSGPREFKRWNCSIDIGWFSTFHAGKIGGVIWNHTIRMI